MDLLVLRGDSKGIMGIDRVVFEVVREGPEEELVANATLNDVRVRRCLFDTPVSEGSGRVVNGVEAVGADQGDSVRQDSTGDGISRSDTDSRNHRLFIGFSNDTWVHLDEIRVVIELAEGVRNGWVGVDFLKCIVPLQAKELPEFVQGSNFPFPSLLNSEDFDKPENMWDISSTKCALERDG